MKPQMIYSAAATLGPFLTLILSSQRGELASDAMSRPGIPLPTTPASSPEAHTRQEFEPDFRFGSGGERLNAKQPATISAQTVATTERPGEGHHENATLPCR